MEQMLLSTTELKQLLNDTGRHKKQQQVSRVMKAAAAASMARRLYTYIGYGT